MEDKSIKSGCVVSATRDMMGIDFFLQHDNCGNHIAQSARECCENCGVDVPNWPSISPD